MTRLEIFLRSDLGKHRRRREWAKLCRLSESYFSEVATGKKVPSIRVFERISAATGVSVADLVAQRATTTESSGTSPDDAGRGGERGEEPEVVTSPASHETGEARV